MIEASVIVPTYRDWERLALCLKALGAQSVAPERFEILVADNNAPDPPPALAMPANARIVPAPGPGSYAARNAALAEAQGAVIFFTDSDCRPAPGWIEAGLKAFAAAPEVERFAGPVELIPAGAEWSVPELHDRVFALKQEFYVARGRAATANLMVRRSLFDRVGPFDATLLSGGDMEWNNRATKAGARIELAPDAMVLHPARASFEEHAVKVRRLVGGRLARGEKARPPLARLLPRPRILTKLLANGIAPREALRVWWFDYRLQKEAFREYRRLRAGGAAERR